MHEAALKVATLVRLAAGSFRVRVTATLARHAFGQFADWHQSASTTAGRTIPEFNGEQRLVAESLPCGKTRRACYHAAGPQNLKPCMTKSRTGRAHSPVRQSGINEGCRCCSPKRPDNRSPPKTLAECRGDCNRSAAGTCLPTWTLPALIASGASVECRHPCRFNLAVETVLRTRGATQQTNRDPDRLRRRVPVAGTRPRRAEVRCPVPSDRRHWAVSSI